MDEGYVTAALFLDLKKAFDTIDHKILTDKLKEHGINGNELSWFTSYLSDRTQAVKIGTGSSLSQFKYQGLLFKYDQASYETLGPYFCSGE